MFLESATTTTTLVVGAVAAAALSYRFIFLSKSQDTDQCDQIGLVPAPRAVFRIWRAGKIWRIHYIGAGFRLRWGWFSKNRM